MAITFKKVQKNIPNRDCGCSGKGPHKRNCLESGQVQPRRITKQVSKPTVRSTGIQLGRKAKPSREEYPEGFRGITEEGKAYVVMVQVAANDNTVRFEEVGETDVTSDTDWTVLIPKLWLEAANEDIEAVLVTIEPLPEEAYEELGIE